MGDAVAPARVATARPHAPLARDAGLLVRIALVPVCVLVCYQLEWRSLRFLTSGAVLRASELTPAPMGRLDYDLLDLGGERVRFVVSCTLIDALCGALPLLWDRRLSLARNALALAASFAIWWVLNVARLEAGFFLYARGAPWWLVHDLVSGATYFLLLRWIVRRGSWAT